MWRGIRRGGSELRDVLALDGLLVVLVLAVGAACAPTDDGALVSTSTNAAEASPTSTSVVSQRPRSEGTVSVGDKTYFFTVACYAPGAGDLLALGVGGEPGSDSVVELYLQAFLGAPYIGLRLGDGTLLEPSLDAPFDVYFQDDVIRASAIRFVRSLDLESGEATEVGFGELEITCADYSRELPP